MKRLKYLSDQRRITSFTYNDDFTGDVVVAVETTCNNTGTIKYNSVSLPIEQLVQFIKEYETVSEKVKFAGLS